MTAIGSVEAMLIVINPTTRCRPSWLYSTVLAEYSVASGFYHIIHIHISAASCSCS